MSNNKIQNNNFQMRFPSLSPELCAELARDIFGNPNANANKTNEALDKEIQESLIGTTFEVAAEIWNLIDPLHRDDELKKAHPKHMFYSLTFLYTYCTEAILVRVFHHVDPKTFRKWVWLFVPAISSLKPRVVSALFLSLFLEKLCLTIFIDCLEPSF